MQLDNMQYAIIQMACVITTTVGVFDLRWGLDRYLQM